MSERFSNICKLRNLNYSFITIHIIIVENDVYWRKKRLSQENWNWFENFTFASILKAYTNRNKVKLTEAYQTSSVNCFTCKLIEFVLKLSNTGGVF